MNESTLLEELTELRRIIASKDNEIRRLTDMLHEAVRLMRDGQQLVNQMSRINPPDPCTEGGI